MGDWADDYGGYDGLDHQHFMEDRANERRAQRAKLLTPPAQEPIADVRGLLAARLTCWHRLTGVESDELVALFQAQPVQPVQEQWLQAVTIKIEAALLSHRLSLHNDADDDGVGFPLVDALCCGQTSLDIGKQEVEDIVEAIYHVLAANIPTAAQPAQEPVAWGVFEGNLHDMFFTQEEAQEMADLKGTHAEVRPFYTTPPQRPWVDLRDSQIETIYYEVVSVHRGAPMPQGQVIFGRAVQAKLKEENT